MTTTISNDMVQRAIIYKLKNSPQVTALLKNENAQDIKEDQYAGSEFNYPAVRVDIVRLNPRNESYQCELSLALFNVRCYVEGVSSQPADQLAGMVKNALHRASVNDTNVPDVEFTMPEINSTGLIAANRTTERVWMAMAMFSANVYPLT